MSNLQEVTFVSRCLTASRCHRRRWSSTGATRSSGDLQHQTCRADRQVPEVWARSHRRRCPQWSSGSTATRQRAAPFVRNLRQSWTSRPVRSSQTKVNRRRVSNRRKSDSRKPSRRYRKRGTTSSELQVTQIILIVLQMGRHGSLHYKDM